MPYEREHRLDDLKLLDLLDKLESGISEVEVPGKLTHTQLVWMTGRFAGRGASTPHAGPGRRTVHGAPRLGFHDFRALALRDVLSRLGHKRALREATLAAADPEVAGRVAERERGLTRPVDRQTPSPQGLGLWRAAERRAVTLYRRALSTGTVALETRAVAAALASIGSGVPLESAVCRKMEGILGVRLDRVRIHTGAVARDAADAASAEAFTVGEDIFFPSYDPTSAACQKLLLHELVHCCQWWQGRITTSGNGVGVSQPGDALEQEAEAVVARAPLVPRALAGHQRAGGRRPSAHRDGVRALPHQGRPMVVDSAAHSASPSGSAAIGVDGTPTGFALAPTPVAPAAVQPIAPMTIASSATPLMVMRQAKSEQAVPKSDLPDREFFAWIDTFLKGDYRWQIAIQDLFRSSLWAPKDHIAEVAGEYADFITENRDLILVSLGIFLAAGAGAVFGSGAAAAVGTALLVGFGVAGFVFATEAMVKHALRWLQLVRRANGKPEGIAAASKEFIYLMVSFAMAVEAAAGKGALVLGNLARTLASWLQTRFSTPKRGALADPHIQTVRVPNRDDVDAAYAVPGHGSTRPPAVEESHVQSLAPPPDREIQFSSMTENQQLQWLRSRPIWGMSPSGDKKTSRSGPTQSQDPESAPKNDRSPGAAPRLLPVTTDRTYLIRINENNLNALIRVIKEGGLTAKELRETLGHKQIAAGVARNFLVMVNGALATAQRTSKANPENIGEVVLDPVSRKYVFRRPSELKQTRAAHDDFKKLTTKDWRPVKLPDVGEVSIKVTLIQHSLLEEVVKQGSRTKKQIEIYLKQFEAIVGPLNVNYQIDQLRIAVQFARGGPGNADNIGTFGVDPNGVIKYSAPKTALVPIKFGRVQYWFDASSKVTKVLEELTDPKNLVGVRLDYYTVKVVNKALDSARLENRVDAPTQKIGSLKLIAGSSRYMVELKPENQQPPPGKVRRYW